MAESEEQVHENMYAELVRSGVNMLTEEETWEMFDRQARSRTNMSGQEFIRAWDAGEFDDDPESVMFVGMLVDVVRSSAVRMGKVKG